MDPEYPGGGHENKGGSEMVGESSTRRSNVSCLSASSTVNLFGETGGGQDFGCLDTGTDDVDIIYDAAMQLHHAWPCSPIYFEGIDQQTYGCSMELDGLMKESYAGEVGVVCSSNALRRWKKLLCVLRWLMRKRVCADVTPSRKKRKVG